MYNKITYIKTYYYKHSLKMKFLTKLPEYDDPGYGDAFPYWLLVLGFWYDGWYTDPGKPGVPGWPI